MLTIEDLNQDCLELVYEGLSARDFFSLSLLSRTFFRSVTPRLYRSLVFHTDHAKRYQKILNPFTVVQLHPTYATFVRAIDIRAAPLYKGAVHTTFLKEYLRTLEMSTALFAFTCTQSILVPQSLRALQDHPNIRHIRVGPKLTSQDDCRILWRLDHLESLSLDAATWSVIDALHNWIQPMTATLTALTLYSLTDLNDTVLRSTLSSLPNLTKLHVVNCVKIQHDLVILLTAHTPKLQSLAFTCWEQSSSVTTVSPLPYLRHLAIDNHVDSVAGRYRSSWSTFIALTQSWNCSLTSIVLKPSIRATLPDSVVTALMKAHETTIQHMVLLNCEVTMGSLWSITSRCTSLERLGVAIPHKDIYSVAEAFSQSSTLDTFQDIGDTSRQQAGRTTLTKDNVRLLMDSVPTLQKVIAQDRVWSGRRREHGLEGRYELTFEKRRNPTPGHWFAPPSSGWT